MKISPLGKAVLMYLAMSLVDVAVAQSLDGTDLETELKPGEAYLLFDSDVNRDGVSLKLDDKHVYFLKRGKTLHAYRIKAGRYQWESINVPDYELPFYLSLNKNSQWSFTIEERKVNYIGRVLVDSQRGINKVPVKIKNRSAMMLDDYRDVVSFLLERYVFVYGGADKDDFLRFYQNTLKQENQLAQP